MVAVVAQVAVGEDHGVAAGAHGHLPLVRHLAVHVDEVDLAAGGLRGDEGVAAAGQGGIVGDEADAAAALGDLVDGAGSQGKLRGKISRGL